jgi:hypothetical protein
MAVGWGGLVCAIGLIAGTGRGDVALVVAVAVAFGVGGFLAGVRATDLRPLHAVLAGLAAIAFHAAFVVLASLADALGGPEAPGFLPGSNARWGIALLVGLAAAAAGGITAAMWLRPQGRDARRRVA